MTAPFRVGVVGCGEQGWESRIPASQALADENVVVLAVADRDHERARWVARDLGVPFAYGSLEEMVDRVALDALVVALPPAFHRWAVGYALEHGLHVLCEKPFGRDVAEAAEMIHAARRADRILAAGYQYPYQAEWAIRQVRSGAVGRPYLLEATWIRSSTASDRGIPDRRDFWDNPQHRGVGLDLASHLLSVILPMAGSAPAAVTAVGWSHFGRAAHGDAFQVEDTLSTAVDFASGARGQLTVAWGAHLNADERRVRCLGADASVAQRLMAAELGGRDFLPALNRPDGALVFGPAPTPTEECFVVQERNWLRACRGEEALRSAPEDALAVHIVLDAIYESVARGGAQVRT